MGRGNTDLSSNEYDSFLTSKAASGSKSARQELQQRQHEKRHAHDTAGVGYHFGLGDTPVKIRSKEHLKSELSKRGLMLEVDVKKDLR